MVPEGWKAAKLGSVFKNRRERGDASLPTFSVTLNDGLVLRESLERKTETNLTAEEHLLVRKGDIAYNMMRMWQGASGLAQVDAIVSPAYVVLEATKDMDPVFASYLFKSARMIYLFWAYSYGLTNDRLRLYYPDFALIPAVLPPVEEQRRIANIMQTWDRAIEVVERLIANSHEQKLAMMQRLLTGSQRLTVFRNQPWSEAKLVDRFEFLNGRAFAPEDWTDTGIPIIRIQNLTGTQTEFNRFQGEVEEKNLIRNGDFLLSWSATLDVFIWRSEDAVLNQHIFKVIPRDGVDRMFGYHLIGFEIEKLKSKVHGTGMKHLTKKDLSKLTARFPLLAEQKAIAKILNAADRQVDLLKVRRASLETEKTFLAEQLLSGKRRLTHPRDPSCDQWMMR